MYLNDSDSTSNILSPTLLNPLDPEPVNAENAHDSLGDANLRHFITLGFNCRHIDTALVSTTCYERSCTANILLIYLSCVIVLPLKL